MLNYLAQYLSKGTKSLYFDVANIKRYSVYEAVLWSTRIAAAVLIQLCLSCLQNKGQ